VRGAPQPRFAAAMRLPARPDPRERDPEEAVRMSQAQPRVAAFEGNVRRGGWGGGPEASLGGAAGDGECQTGRPLTGSRHIEVDVVALDDSLGLHVEDRNADGYTSCAPRVTPIAI